MDQRTNILTLQTQLSDHIKRSHWAVSMRIFGKGDFFKKLHEGGDCRTATAAKALQWFSDNWPEDLAWPKDIARPSRGARRAA